MEETMEEFTDSGIDPLTVSRISCHPISGLCRTLKPDSLSILSSSKSSSSSLISFFAGFEPEPVWQNRLQLLGRLEHQVGPTIFFLFFFESHDQAAKPDWENTLVFFQELELTFDHGRLQVHTESRGMKRAIRGPRHECSFGTRYDSVHYFSTNHDFASLTMDAHLAAIEASLNRC
ncbi:hypothetical protein ACFXTH_022319 [Malus domestica]